MAFFYSYFEGASDEIIGFLFLANTEDSWDLLTSLTSVWGWNLLAGLKILLMDVKVDFIVFDFTYTHTHTHTHTHMFSCTQNL